MTSAPTAPAFAAVIVHGTEESHIGLVELSSGQVKLLQPEVDRPKGLAISADGRWIAYSSRATLYLRSWEQPPRVLTEHLDWSADPPYAFQPDAPFIAVSVGGSSIQFLPLDAEASSSLRFPLPNGCRASQLLWSLSGGTLHVLCAPPPGVKDAWIVAISPAARLVRTIPAPGLSRLLAFRSETEFVAARTVLDGDEALLSSQPGEYKVLRPAKENEFISSYIPGQHRLVIVQGIEDTGDQTVLCVASGEPCSPWLTSLKHVTDLSFTPDGRWAIFTERPPVDAELPGGDIYVAATDNASARMVVKAGAERSYSSPVFRSAQGR